MAVVEIVAYSEWGCDEPGCEYVARGTFRTVVVSLLQHLRSDHLTATSWSDTKVCVNSVTDMRYLRSTG